MYLTGRCLLPEIPLYNPENATGFLTGLIPYVSTKAVKQKNKRCM